MATRPSASSPTTFSVNGTTVSVAYTTVTSRAIYCPTSGHPTSVVFDDGTPHPLTQRAKWTATWFGTNHGSVWTLPPVVAGTVGTLTVTGASGHYSGIAFNIADCNTDADLIQFGGRFRDAGTTTITRAAYAWDPDGLQVAFLWCGLGVVGMTLSGTGVSTLASGNGTTCATVAANDSEINITGTRLSAGHTAVFTFLIPAAHPRTGGNYFPIVCGDTSLSSLAAGSSVIVGLPYGGVPQTGVYGTTIPIAGTLRSWGMKTTAAPGASKSVTAEILRGGNSQGGLTDPGFFDMFGTGITNIIAGASATQPVTPPDNLTFGWSRYERLAIKYTNSGVGALPAGFSITSSFLIETADPAMVFGNGQHDSLSSVTTADIFYDRCPLHPSGGNLWVSNANSQKGLVGIDLADVEILAENVLCYDTGQTVELYLRKNGTLQDGTGGTVDTKATIITESYSLAMARRTVTIAYAPGDTLAVSAVYRAGSSFATLAVVVRLTPATAGQFMVSGTAAQSGSADAIAQFNSSLVEISTTLGNEFALGNIVPPMTTAGVPFRALGVIELLETAGPSPGTLTSKFRANEGATAMPDLVFSGSETADSVSGNVALVGGDRFALLQDVASAPSLTRQFWSMPGSFQVPGEIIVVKDAGGNVVQSFDFTTVGLSPSTFALVGGDSQTFTGVLVGSGYGVSEDTPLPTDWQLSSATTSNGSPINNITVADGETVTVTFVNVNVGPDTTTYAIRRQRRATHLSSEQLWQFFSMFQLDLQAGVGLSTGQGSDPQLMLRWSDDGGFTWSNEHWVSAGKIGEYTRRAIWRRLGRGRDRIFELTMTDPVLWALLAAELNVERGTS